LGKVKKGEKMKLRTIRYSGLPVDPTMLEKYDKAWKEAYDAIMAEHGQDMLTVHGELEKLEAKLQSEYGNIELRELPKSTKAWMQFIDSLDCPIMLAKSSENPKELVIVVVDRPFG
jgi:hypothetical protein